MHHFGIYFLGICINTVGASFAHKFIGIAWLAVCLSRTFLCEKYPNTQFFLARVFPYSDQIWTITEKISVLSPKTEKYEPEKTLYLATLHPVTCVVVNSNYFVWILPLDLWRLFTKVDYSNETFAQPAVMI